MTKWLEPVQESERKVLENLLQFYIYDFTDYLDLRVEYDGRFANYPLDAFWGQEPQLKHAYFIKCKGELAGFALIEALNGHPDGDYYVTEFFVLRKFRRSGVGKAAAHELFRKYEGRWIVQQIPKNIPAQAFWRKTIEEFAPEGYVEKTREENGNIIQLFRSEG
ncbi:GNAT family N-acetyltransferase [Paenibacillus sp. CAA11]|uniref:GNAT family N-acetyltransferase n=1 Tax=Paenibacillus sp. CAA11 TaxID=1532905 RepID=UPI000D356F0B|nr:GNAT family N-acetyltransferase [Paenibacillus sp. CAA11]AWB44813.1 GNAT family N-acetyltransferase [Paenibacillus sp. CAA11]